MRTSSASQLELSLSYSGQGRATGSEASQPASDANSGVKTPAFGFPSVDPLAEARAVTARIAGRLNAASISRDEHEALLRERQALLDKKFSGSMTRKEEIRLEYVRWSLDRIDDAKHGQELDLLEGLAAQYESFLSNLHRLEEDLLQHRGTRG